MTGTNRAGGRAMFMWAAILACVLPAEEARAQEAGVRAVVEQIFDGMREADADKVRAGFAAEARFAMLNPQDGSIRMMSPDRWFEGIAGSEGRWDEQIYDVEVWVDGAMAVAWVPYTFYLDGEISHCGVNSVHLLRDAEGWKITQLSDTRSQENCPDPHGG